MVPQKVLWRPFWSTTKKCENKNLSWILFQYNFLKCTGWEGLIQSESREATSATDTGIQKKIFGPDITTLTISNEEMNDIMKIIKSFEDTGLLIKGVGETIENEAREQKRGFLDMF